MCNWTRNVLWMALALAGLWLLPPSFQTSTRADWPRFRGPNGSGIDPAANPPVSFTDKDYNWKIDLPGVGHSSPVVIGQKIFITCSETSGALRYLYCIDLDTGKTLWKKTYDSRGFKQHTFNSFSSASAVADDQRVYFTFISPESYKVFCVDHSGKDLWNYDMGRWESMHGCGCSPILVDDVLIVPNDQDGPTASLVALDKVSGSQRWQIPRKTGKNGAAASTPCIFFAKDGPQLITSSREEGVSAIEPKTGKVIWQVPDVLKFRPVGSPIATANLVLASCGEGDRNRSCVAIKPGERSGQAPQVIYQTPTGADYPYVPSVLVDGKYLFLWSDIGTVTCADAAKGTKIWQEKLKSPLGKPEFFTSPIVAGKKLYNISKKGEVYCLEIGEKYKELGRSQLGDQCYSTPAIVGDRLIIRTDSHLLSVGGKK